MGKTRLRPRDSNPEIQLQRLACCQLHQGARCGRENTDRRGLPSRPPSAGREYSFDATNREARNFLGAPCERVRHPLRARSPRQLDSKPGRHLDVTGARGVVVGREPTQLEPRGAVSRQGDDCRRILPGRWVQASPDTGRRADPAALEIDRHNFGHSRDLAGVPREVGDRELLVDVPKADPRATRPIPNEQLGIRANGKTGAQPPPPGLAFLLLLPRALRDLWWSPVAGRHGLAGGPGVARTAASSDCEGDQADGHHCVLRLARPSQEATTTRRRSRKDRCRGRRSAPWRRRRRRRRRAGGGPRRGLRSARR
jgi:hypothetical protein